VRVPPEELRKLASKIAREKGIPIGQATHLAWVILAKKYRTVKLDGSQPEKTHHKTEGATKEAESSEELVELEKEIPEWEELPLEERVERLLAIASPTKHSSSESVVKSIVPPPRSGEETEEHSLGGSETYKANPSPHHSSKQKFDIFPEEAHSGQPIPEEEFLKRGWVI